MADGVEQPAATPKGEATSEEIDARRIRRAHRKRTRAAMGSEAIRRLSPDGAPPAPAPMRETAEIDGEDEAPAKGGRAKSGAAKGETAGKAAAVAEQDAQLPAKARKTDVAKKKKNEIAAPVVDDEAFEAARRAREARMREIRGELRRRRRWRALGMLARLMIFVLIPTWCVGWYYFEKATDIYVSESTMIFKSGSNASTGGGLLGAVMGSSPTDSVALQEYIKSRDILQRLDDEHGMIAHYKSE
ncbi:MAG: hypothetical protein AAFP78_04900, partial [Pseudomonadota bacterium]